MLIVFTVFAPSNRGLRYVREQGLFFLSKNFSGLELKIEEHKGEDIPGLVKDLYYDNKSKVAGLTGEDLLVSYIAGTIGNNIFGDGWENSLVLKYLCLRGKGPYEKAVFGLPSLCILGRNGIDPDKFAEAYTSRINYPKLFSEPPDFRGKKVAIVKRYENLIRSRIRLEDAGLITLDRKADIAAAKGEADYAIDVVLEGKTCRSEGLGLFPPVVFFSDGVALGNKNLKPSPYEPKIIGMPYNSSDGISRWSH